MELELKKNYKEAVRLYRGAANQGNDRAQNNLADCYYNGYGVMKDPNEAAYLYRLAAGLGNSFAKFNLKEKGYECEK